MSRNGSGDGADRRRFLQVTGGGLLAAALPAGAAPAGAEITGRLARYMVEARDRPLPTEVVLACKHRIGDAQHGCRSIGR